MPNSNNPESFLEGWEQLHKHLSRFARNKYKNTDLVPVEQIKDKVGEIIRFERKEEGRINQWRSAIESSAIYPAEVGESEISYDAEDWEGEKHRFHTLAFSTESIDSNVYRFHKAAALHRYSVLKELLPAHNVAVY